MPAGVQRRCQSGPGMPPATRHPPGAEVATRRRRSSRVLAGPGAGLEPCCSTGLSASARDPRAWTRPPHRGGTCAVPWGPYRGRRCAPHWAPDPREAAHGSQPGRGAFPGRGLCVGSSR